MATLHRRHHGCRLLASIRKLNVWLSYQVEAQSIVVGVHKDVLWMLLGWHGMVALPFRCRAVRVPVEWSEVRREESGGNTDRAALSHTSRPIEVVRLRSTQSR